MPHRYIPKPVYALTAIVLFGLVACGGGGGGDDDDSSGVIVGGGDIEVPGFFIDDTVQGLQYQIDGGAVQVTDEYGVFTCLLDESTLEGQLSFFVDGIPLGAADCRVRVTPNDFGVTGLNIARFLQSLDTTPGIPGIDLTGLDLPDTPINFNQGNDSFTADTAVNDAVAAAALAGANGVLVSVDEALVELAAGTSGGFAAADLANLALYPVIAGTVNEPCFVLFRADGSGFNLCRDDIVEDPSNAAEEFAWSIDGSLAVLEFDYGAGVEDRVTVQRLGTTGNRISTDVVSNCLVCDPNVEPAITTERTTLLTALPISASDFEGVSLTLSGIDTGISASLIFNADGTGTLVDGTASTQSFIWSVDSDFELLVLRGSGTPGADLLYHRLILTEGTVGIGTYAAILARATDTDNSGVIDGTEFDDSGVFEAVDLLVQN